MQTYSPTSKITFLKTAMKMPDEPINPITDPLQGKQVPGTPITKTEGFQHLSEEQTH